MSAVNMELPKHLRYNPCPEIVRAHEQWQSAIRQTVSQLQSMGHVRAPEAIANVVMPLFLHVDTLFTLLQADLGAYAEQVMVLSQDAAGGDNEVIIGLHPQDAEAIASQIDEIYELVEKVSKGIKEGSDQRKMLDDAVGMLGELQEAIMSTSLEEDEVPDEDDEVNPPAPVEEPPPTPDDLSDTPLQIA